MSRFTLDIRDNQATPISVANLGPEATGLRMSTVLDGGCAACSFRVATPTHVIPNWIGYNYELRVMDEAQVVWIGRLEDAVAHKGDDGEYWGLTFNGYGVNLDDQLYTSQNVQNIETSTIMSSAITALTEQIGATSITATGFTIANTASVNLKLLTAAGVAKWVKRYGDSSNNPQVWYIYPDVDGTVRFTFKPRPTTPDLDGSRSDFEMSEFGFSGRQRANRLVVEYNGGASFVTVEDTALQAAGPAGWGVIRTRIVVIPEISNATDATQAGNALLTAYKTLRMEASMLQLKKKNAFRNSDGQYVPPYLIRAGQLLKFNDIDPAEGGLGSLSFNNSCLIVGTDYEEDTQILSLTPESHEDTLDSLVAQVRSLLQGRHTV